MRIFSLFCEVVLLLLKTFIFMNMITPSKEDRFFRIMMYISSVPLVVTFFTCTYHRLIPDSLAVFLCISLPSFFIFMLLSKHKGFRLYVTFCMVETFAFIMAFYGRLPGILGDESLSAIFSAVVLFVAFLIYFSCGKCFSAYREIMEKVDKGWGLTAISSTLIYALLIILAIYPKPLTERHEYVMTYCFMTFVMISFYVVFIAHIRRKRELLELNEQLLAEKEWHHVAYIDALTGMNNRMAFVENINEAERNFVEGSCVFAVMIDIDGFKSVNDVLGHHVGDDTLKKAAQHIGDIFSEEEYISFRIGGDEFAIIATNVECDALDKKLDELKALSLCDELPCGFSVGYSSVDIKENSAFESAFIRADKEMYEDKNLKKTSV